MGWKRALGKEDDEQRKKKQKVETVVLFKIDLATGVIEDTGCFDLFLRQVHLEFEIELDASGFTVRVPGQFTVQVAGEAVTIESVYYESPEVEKLEDGRISVRASKKNSPFPPAASADFLRRVTDNAHLRFLQTKASEDPKAADDLKILEAVAKAPAVKSNTCLANYRPFEGLVRERSSELHCFLAGSPNEDQLVDHLIGAAVGGCLGDALGAHLEFKRHVSPPVVDVAALRAVMESDAPSGHFKLPFGATTDDTAMALCSLHSCKKNGRPYCYYDKAIRFHCWWKAGMATGFTYIPAPGPFKSAVRGAIGLGGCIAARLGMGARFQGQAVKPDIEEGPSTNIVDDGNGGLMRNWVIASLYGSNDRSLQQLALWSAFDSKITHGGHKAAMLCGLHTCLQVLGATRFRGDPAGLLAPAHLEALWYTVLEPVFRTHMPRCADRHFHTLRCIVESRGESIQYDEIPGTKEDVRLDQRVWVWRTDGRLPLADADRNKPSIKIGSAFFGGGNPGYVGAYAPDGLTLALHCLWNAKSAQEALDRAVSMRGDADSVGAITGAMAGAVFGMRGPKGLLAAHDGVLWRKACRNSAVLEIATLVYDQHVI